MDSASIQGLRSRFFKKVFTFSNGSTETKVFFTSFSYDSEILKYFELLHEEERFKYEGYKSITKKKEYLAGRIVAKECIGSIKKEIQFDDVNIDSGVWGFPLITYPKGLGHISIAHTGDEACAIYLNIDTHPMGVDVEEVNASMEDALDRMITEDERSKIAIADITDKTVMWCAKEAAGKVLRLGFHLPESLYEIEEIQVQKTRYLIKYKNLAKIESIAWRNGKNIFCIAYPSEWEIDTE